MPKTGSLEVKEEETAAPAGRDLPQALPPAGAAALVFVADPTG
jgi:hypothetical protein